MKDSSECYVYGLVHVYFVALLSRSFPVITEIHVDGMNGEHEFQDLQTFGGLSMDATHSLYMPSKLFVISP